MFDAAASDRNEAACTPEAAMERTSNMGLWNTAAC
jgi:hypothetical protein